MKLIVHICQESDWDQALKDGEYRAESLESEGFIHGSMPEQVLPVINRFYSDQEKLLLLWLDVIRIEPDVRWEFVDGDHYPHIYGVLNLDAVVGTQVLLPEDDGVYREELRFELKG